MGLCLPYSFTCELLFSASELNVLRFMMAMSSSNMDVGSVVAVISAVTLLVAALHKWHIDVLKASKPAAKMRADQPQSISAETNLRPRELITPFHRKTASINLVVYVLSMLFLIFLAVGDLPHQATSKDVALIPY
jgi:hypothetical protein